MVTRENKIEDRWTLRIGIVFLQIYGVSQLCVGRRHCWKHSTSAAAKRTRHYIGIWDDERLINRIPVKTPD